jgi:hypothetical protein
MIAKYRMGLKLTIEQPEQPLFDVLSFYDWDLTFALTRQRSLKLSFVEIQQGPLLRLANDACSANDYLAAVFRGAIAKIWLAIRYMSETQATVHPSQGTFQA